MKLKKLLEEAGIKKKKREKPLTSPCGKDLKIYCIDTGYNMAIKELNTLSITIDEEKVKEKGLALVEEFLPKGEGEERGKVIVIMALFLNYLFNTDGIIKIGREG